MKHFNKASGLDKTYTCTEIQELPTSSDVFSGLGTTYRSLWEDQDGEIWYRMHHGHTNIPTIGNILRIR